MKQRLILFLFLLISSIGYGQAVLTPVNVGTTANDRTGDPLRTAMQKLNANDVYLDTYGVERLDSLITAGVGSVADEINNGETEIAPSQNAVFDALALKAALASPTFTGTPAAPTAADGTNTTQLATTAYVLSSAPKYFGVALSDLTTALTTGTSKAYFRVPVGMIVTGVRASLLTAQSSGSIITIDINEAGTTILSTKLTIDNSEKTSTTAATASVISDSVLADDSELTFDIDVVGTGGAGLIVWIIGY